MMKFEVGKKYDCSSICDGDCVFEFEVIKRTEKTVTIKDSFGKEKRCKIYTENDEEYIYPLGKYSMCPTLRSSKEIQEKTQTSMTVKTKKEAWEIADKLFLTDYDKNEQKSNAAGYPIYTNNINHDQIADLNNRLELTVDGKTTNIWVESVEADDENIEEIDRTRLKELIESNLAVLTVGEKLEKLGENSPSIVFYKLDGEWHAYIFSLFPNNQLFEHHKDWLSNIIKDIDNQAVVIGIHDFKDWDNNLVTLDEMVCTVEYKHTLPDCRNNINIFLERLAEQEQQEQRRYSCSNVIYVDFGKAV